MQKFKIFEIKDIHKYLANNFINLFIKIIYYGKAQLFHIYYA